MPRKIIHSETVSRASRAQVYSRVKDLEAQHPGARVSHRWNSRQGHFTIAVSVEGETKIQTRGHCQFCGNHQVVISGTGIVLHGYERPGHGWIHGRCPGVGLLPLQREDKHTRGYLANTVAALDNLEAMVPGLMAEFEAARGALYASTESTYEARVARPRAPWKHDATDAKIEAYNDAVALWTERFPLTAAHEIAGAAVSANESAIRQTLNQREHFKILLGWNLVGTPLLEVEK